MPKKNRKRVLWTPHIEPRWNYYRCTKCHRILVTVDVQEGVTPMFLACNGPIADRGRMSRCDGDLVSAMYPPTKTWPPVAQREPTAEWAVPDKVSLKRMPQATKDHVAKGGLLLRPLTGVYEFPED